MEQASKFSQSYDEREDRILMITEKVASGAVRLWLTQRLANRLVKALVEIFEKTDGRDVQSEHQPTVQAWEQAAAVAQFTPREPVAANEAKTDSLIHSVSIQTDGHHYVLTLAGDHDGAFLRLTSAELRQWFTVLHSHYVAAEWSQSIWPIWITTPAPTDMNTVSNAIN